MGAIADCVMEVYALESCILRAEKVIAARGEATAKQAIAMTRYYAAKAMQTVEFSSRKVIAAVAEGDMLRTQMAILRRLSKHEPEDTIGPDPGVLCMRGLVHRDRGEKEAAPEACETGRHVRPTVEPVPGEVEVAQHVFGQILETEARKDAREIVVSPDTDAVVVVTPTTTHFPLAKLALESRKHVLVEKPPAMRGEEMEELVRLSEERDLVCMPGHLLLYFLCGRALWLLEHVRAKGQDHHLLRAGAPDWMRRLVGRRASPSDHFAIASPSIRGLPSTYSA